MRTRGQRFVLFGAALALLCAAACRPRPAAPALPRPLVVIGVDGLEWRLVLDLAARGRLPELKRLIEDGTAVRLGTLEPALSPPIWTSMGTGVLPDTHGIRAFVQPGLHDAEGRPLLYTNRERRVKAVWNIADDSGLSSCVVGYWMTFPVEAIRGVMVAQTGTPPGDGEPARKGALHDGASGQVHPPELEERVFAAARQSAAAAASRELELYGDRSTWPAAMQRLVDHSRWSLAADTAYQRIALDLVSEPGRCDLAIVYLGLADVLGHRFWRWTYPGDFASPPPPQETAAWGDVLARAYGQIDSFVGEMRRAAGPHATVIVASDHGMGAFRPNAPTDVSRADGPLLRNGGHSAARDALFVAAGPGVRTGARLASRIDDVPKAGSILDFAPTLLALLGLPRGADMPGRVLVDVLDPAFVAAHPLREVPTHTHPDWPRTRRLADSAAPANVDRVEQLRGLGYLE